MSLTRSRPCSARSIPSPARRPHRPPSATNARGAARVEAITKRVRQNLERQTGQQTSQDIQADRATAQATMTDAGARQTHSQAMLQNIIAQAETVSTDQVASEILALQT